MKPHPIKNLSLPHAVSFSDARQVDQGVEIISEPAVISGLADGDTSVMVALSGHDSAEMRINGGEWTDGGEVFNEDEIELRLTSGDDYRISRQAQITFDGEQPAAFEVVTDDPPMPSEVTLQSTTITSESTYDELADMGGTCQGAYSNGQEVTTADYIDDSDVVQWLVGGTTAYGCVTNVSGMRINGVLMSFNSATFVYAQW